MCRGFQNRVKVTNCENSVYTSSMNIHTYIQAKNLSQLTDLHQEIGISTFEHLQIGKRSVSWYLIINLRIANVKTNLEYWLCNILIC